jgi:hypothetical protein
MLSRRRLIATPVILGLLGLSVANTEAIHRQLAPTLADVERAAEYLACTEPSSPIYVDAFGTDLYLRLFSGDRLSDVRIMRRGTRFPNGAMVLVGGMRGLYFAEPELEIFYRENAPVLVEDLEGRETPPFFSLMKEFSSARGRLRVYHVANLPTDPPEPPILEVSIAEHRGYDVIVNGFMQPRGEGNELFMALYVNGERIRKQVFFPITVDLPKVGTNAIRVVATDLYGSSTEREVLAERKE